MNNLLSSLPCIDAAAESVHATWKIDILMQNPINIFSISHILAISCNNGANNRHWFINIRKIAVCESSLLYFEALQCEKTKNWYDFNRRVEIFMGIIARLRIKLLSVYMKGINLLIIHLCARRKKRRGKRRKFRVLLTPRAEEFL